ncbi:MAG: hypothetical protein AB1542_16550 [Pseudomonadota bacterium]|jgi:hypothetical protein
MSTIVHHENDDPENSGLNFYAAIGRVVTSYQLIEDHLNETFSAALAIPDSKGEAIFGLARGLDFKLDAISAVLADEDANLKTQWESFRIKIRNAAAARNQIAHATPRERGKTVIVRSVDPDVPHQIFRGVKRELRKSLPKKEVIWDETLMRAECKRSSHLLRELVDFSKALRER